MKYVWLVALLFLMGATWSMGSPGEVARLSDLADRQAEFAHIISDSIKAARPGVTVVDFQQLYIESVRVDKVLRAHFKYVIHEAANDQKNSTDQTLEGTSLLTSDDGGENWQIGKANMTASDIVFNEGTVITPGSHSSEATTAPEPDLKQ